MNKVSLDILFFFSWGSVTQRGSWPPHSWGFLDHTQQRTTVGRTSLDKWSARRRDLYLTTHNTHNRQTSMPPVGFEPTISAGERPQTFALDRTATGTNDILIIMNGKSLMHNRKNSGPSVAPCGTPYWSLSQSDKFLENSFFYYYSVVCHLNRAYQITCLTINTQTLHFAYNIHVSHRQMLL